VINKYFVEPGGARDWNGIWLSFAAYALVVAIMFTILFRHKHDPNAIGQVKH
jgi:hypothetical protein